MLEGYENLDLQYVGLDGVNPLQEANGQKTQLMQVDPMGGASQCTLALVLRYWTKDELVHGSSRSLIPNCITHVWPHVCKVWIYLAWAQE